MHDRAVRQVGPDAQNDKQDDEGLSAMKFLLVLKTNGPKCRLSAGCRLRRMANTMGAILGVEPHRLTSREA